MAADRPSFNGRVDNSLDDKGRLVVPVRFRPGLGTNFYLTVGLPDPCLALYPKSTWEENLRSLAESKKKGPNFREYVRFVFAHTDEAACDSQGRLLLPPALRAYAEIDKDIVTNGNNTRVEIWSRALFEQHVLPVPEKLAARLAAQREAEPNAALDIVEELDLL